MGLLTLLDGSVAILIGDELSEEVLEVLLAALSDIGGVLHVLLLLFEDAALIFQVPVHGCVFLSSVDSLDRCEGVGEAVEVEDMFEVDEPSEALVMAGCLSLKP
jgi:hypothetical protein